jgi:hypothetical protein
MWCEIKRMIFINKFKCIVEVKMRVTNLKLKRVKLMTPITYSDELKNMKKWENDFKKLILY